MPRFDSAPVLCGTLDSSRGGAFRITPEGLTESRHYYESYTAIFVTELCTKTGMVRLTDAMLFRSGAVLREDAAAARCELFRYVRLIKGSVRLRIQLNPLDGADVER